MCKIKGHEEDVFYYIYEINVGMFYNIKKNFKLI
jgi:hypothetical protein